MRNFTNENQEFETLENMDKYAGSFVKELAQLYRLGDRQNQQKLLDTFWNYFSEYLPEKWNK